MAAYRMVVGFVYERFPDHLLVTDAGEVLSHDAEDLVARVLERVAKDLEGARATVSGAMPEPDAGYWQRVKLFFSRLRQGWDHARGKPLGAAVLDVDVQAVITTALTQEMEALKQKTIRAGFCTTCTLMR